MYKVRACDATYSAHVGTVGIIGDMFVRLEAHVKTVLWKAACLAVPKGKSHKG